MCGPQAHLTPLWSCAQAKQDWHMSMDNEFKATKNTRNMAMLADATEFAKNLHTCEKEIQSLKTVTEGEAPAWQQHRRRRCLTQRPLVMDTAAQLHPAAGTCSMLGEGPWTAHILWEVCRAHPPLMLAAGMLLTTRAVMSANLPRVYEDMDGAGDIRPVEVPVHLNKIGGQFDAEELTAIATTTVRPAAAAARALGQAEGWPVADSWRVCWHGVRMLASQAGSPRRS